MTNEKSNTIAKRKPGRPRLEHSPTKLSIIRTGAFLFMDVGYDKVSLETVGKACGITKASVYYYFNNKAELFTECLVTVLSIAHSATVKILSEQLSLKDKLKKIAHAQMSNEHLDFESMMREASVDLSDVQTSAIRAAEKKLHDVIFEAFQEAIQSGELSGQHQPIILAHTFVALLTMKNHLNLKQLPLDQLVDEMIEIVWNGIKNEGVLKS